MPNFEVDPLVLISMLVGTIMWFARIEFVSKQNQKDIVENERRLDKEIEHLHEKFDGVKAELSEINRSLHRIEGALSVKHID